MGSIPTGVRKKTEVALISGFGRQAGTTGLTQAVTLLYRGDHLGA